MQDVSFQYCISSLPSPLKVVIVIPNNSKKLYLATLPEICLKEPSISVFGIDEYEETNLVMYPPLGPLEFCVCC